MRRGASDGLALLLGILGTVGWHLTLFTSGFDRMPGDLGDARTAAYFVEHWYQVFRGQADLASPGMFYPVTGTLGYTDTMFVHALPYSLMRLAGMDMFSALAVPLVLFNFLNFIACFILLRRVLRLDVLPSAVGAMFFAFNSPRFNHPGHFNFQASFFLPLAIAFVILFVRDSANLTQLKAFLLLAAAALCLNLQLVVSLYQGWIFLFWSLLFLAFCFSLRSTRQVVLELIGRFWPALMGSALVLVLGVLPLLLLYLPVLQSVGSRPYSIVEELIPDAWSLVQMGQGNYVWGDLSSVLSRVHALPSTELNIGIGLVPSLAWLALVLWGVRTILRGRGRDQSALFGEADVRNLFLAALILATTFFYAIGMKYWDGRSPWQFVYRFVPGAASLRVVARHVMVLALPMAMAFAVFVHRAMHKSAARYTGLTRRGLTAALLIVLGFGIVEQFGRAPSFSRQRELARLQRLAAALPQGCAAFYAAAPSVRPPYKREYQIDAMLISVTRRVPTLNGYSGHEPPGWSLREVEAPDYEQRIARWIVRYRLTGHVCRLEIGE